MPRSTSLLLFPLLATVVACETPKQTDSSSESRETSPDRERETDPSGDRASPNSQSLAFESLPSADSTEREALLYAAPADPRALLWVFHGRGDSREICRRHHLEPAMRAFVRKGFAVVCPQSLDRTDEAWDGGSVERAGADVANIRRAREALRSRGVVSEGITEFGWGISNGGGFVGTWAYHELSNGTDVRGIHCMIARCRSAAAAGEKFGLYIHWAAAESDPFFPFATVRETHGAYGGPKSLTVAEPAPLTARKLESLAGLSGAGARELRDALKAEGLLRDDGRPSCDPKSNSACRERLTDAYRSVDPDSPRPLVRHVFENCRATHMAFHETCDGDDNTAHVLEAFEGKL